jgi:hypothetical protein
MWILMYVFSYSVGPAATNDRAEWRLLPTVVFQEFSNEEVGVIAQEVRAVRPDAVTVDHDGYLRVSYERLGLPFRSYDNWVASGGLLPKPAGSLHRGHH